MPTDVDRWPQTAGGRGRTVINIAGADNLQKIVILNPKGGCGKTTLATNLASYYASRGSPPTLVDCDPQGFCMRWLDKRPPSRPTIYGIQADFGIRDASEGPLASVEPDSSVVIIDLPAGIPHSHLHAVTYLADNVLLPIVPSEIDIYSATRFIAELLLDVQLDRREQTLAIVANRVRSRTKSYGMLMRFLTSLKIPMVGTLRDSQTFVHASARGIGICEMPNYLDGNDVAQIAAIATWLDKRRKTTKDRQALIAQVAYRNAQGRGFSGGDPIADWLEAEREVDAMLEEGAS
jgi:chromosome partitioning protein